MPGPDTERTTDPPPTAELPVVPVEDPGPPPVVLRLLGMTTYLGIAGFVVAEIVQVATSGWAGFTAASLLNALVWLAGVNSLVVGCGHLMLPDPIARSIGWPTGNPFQGEVGLAGVLIGVLGILAGSGFDRQFQLAALLAFAIFYLGAAVGHVVQIVRRGNRAAGNAGFILWYDVLAPLLVIALYAAS
ncbi:hypothetical protein LWC33_17500 [Pseudonocardia sp. RS11V-5]|uniref:DUF6790 family protein n=1 Tax=Pseudonocardia terrae TaxID=2905831 RepID=UPI001E45E020|nr:DUF6790 family protein [Pseudonocardia terrae]MCE3553246.1 hypothetical protein [Pseudonocardia terrae]